MAEIFRMAAGVCCALILAAGAAWAQALGPLEVIGYSNPDESGPSKIWSLAEGLPYLYVPYVGDELNGSIGRLRMGAEVGAALFQRPFFASRDRGCARELGSNSRPDLAWLGPTARFEPGGDGMPPDAIAAPDEATGGYASMILFRKDLGPPPGMLLMNRRRTLATDCLNAIHKTFYNRVFVPVAAAPERLRCFNLAGEFQVKGSDTRTFRFVISDRLVLLAPSDLSERYRGHSHHFTVTLYDRLECDGESVSFRSGSLAAGSTKLDGYGFRDRARSVKIAYESGPLTAYMAPKAAPAMAQPPAPAPETVATTRAPEPAAEPEVIAKAPQPAAEPEAIGKVAEPAAEPEVIAKAPIPAPEPEVIAKAPEPGVEPEPAAKQALEPVPADQRPVPEIKPDPPAQSAAAPVQPTPAAPAAPAAVASQSQLKLEPVLLPETQVVAGVASQTFAYPVHQVYRLNYCLTPKGDCGEPAAQAWCRAEGFGKATAWEIDENIGALFPTVVLGDNRICAQFLCDGFREITCAN